MIALTNVSPTDVGGYRVVVSNSSGVAISDTATLAVRTEEALPQLSGIGITTNQQFAFRFLGGSGRFYRVESSTNSREWHGISNIVDAEYVFFSNSVVYCKGEWLDFRVPVLDPQQFFRVGRYFPSNELCNLRLKEVRFAKELWRRDNAQCPGDYVNLRRY